MAVGLMCLTLIWQTTLIETPSNAKAIPSKSAKYPKHPRATAVSLAKVMGCSDELLLENGGRKDYSYRCWNSFDSEGVAILVTSVSQKEGDFWKKIILSKDAEKGGWCAVDSDSFVLFTDFRNYSVVGDYRSTKTTKALTKKFKKLFKNSQAFSMSPKGVCKQIK